MKPEEMFFISPENVFHRQYEALRTFCYEKKSAQEVADSYGYTLASFYSLVRDFKKKLKAEKPEMGFFITPQAGRKSNPLLKTVADKIIELRKKYLPVDEIRVILNSQEIHVSESYIYNIIKRDGFGRLPRRNKEIKKKISSTVKIEAPKAELLGLENGKDSFSTGAAGVLCFLPIISSFGINELISKSSYPGTKTIPTLNSIMCFAALKLSSFHRYTADDLWCMDRGLGLFAGLNVLPKAAWFTSYSHRITREMNLNFLKAMNKLWKEKGLLSDTANLDFTSIPYWGDDSHLENNWSGKRNKSLASILAVLGHDPDSGIITYGDTNIRHSNESETALEFLDFYHENGISKLKYLVFDSKFTTYKNLSNLDDEGIKFLTIRRRGKKIIEELENTPKSEWKTIRVEAGNGKKRTIKVLDKIIYLSEYDKEIRQIAITGHGKIKPALIITNDLALEKSLIVRKYARRWLVEKTISEQIYFFHLNKVSSSMVIKVDFDLTMTILAHNLYRLFAMQLEGYSHNTASVIYDKFIRNGGKIHINHRTVNVKLKKKRNLPAILTAMNSYETIKVPWLMDKNIEFKGASNS
jgi:hypothetical protein